jgi:hypothetical protein
MAGLEKACSAPGRRSGEGLYVVRDLNGGSLLWIVWTAWTAPCCSPALWAVWVSSAGKPEPSDARTREMAIRRHRELVGMA